MGLYDDICLLDHHLIPCMIHRNQNCDVIGAILEYILGDGALLHNITNSSIRKGASSLRSLLVWDARGGGGEPEFHCLFALNKAGGSFWPHAGLHGSGHAFKKGISGILIERGVDDLQVIETMHEHPMLFEENVCVASAIITELDNVWICEYGQQMACIKQFLAQGHDIKHKGLCGRGG